MKIVQIDGFKGLITALFICAGLFAGFVLSPGYLAMHLWNKYLVNLLMFPQLNLLQGVLLWAIVAISYCILCKKGFAVSFKNSPDLSDAELDSIIQQAKSNSKIQMMNKVINKTDKLEIKRDEFIKSSPVEKDSFVSSPISINKKNQSEDIKDENVTNLK